MKPSHLIFGLAALGALLAGGCKSVEYSAANDPNRVLIGTVTFMQPTTLPPDAEVLVRVVDRHPQPANMDIGGIPSPDRLPLLSQPQTAAALAAAGPETLGEQIVRNPGSSPVVFRVEYRAEDDLLRRGLNIEVRISYGGRLRLFNANQYEVGLNDVNDPHAVEADPVH